MEYHPPNSEKKTIENEFCLEFKSKDFRIHMFFRTKYLEISKILFTFANIIFNLKT